MSALEAAVQRLENVAARLESLGAYGSAVAAPGTAMPARPAVATTAAAASPAAVAGSVVGSPLAEYDRLLAANLQPLVMAAAALSPQVQQATSIMQQAFQSARRVLEVSAASQDPGPQGIDPLVAPVGECLAAASTLSEDRRSPAINHFKAVSDSLNALMWLVYTGPSCGMSTPRQHVAESWQAAEFFANKVLMEFRGKDESQVAWVKALKELMVQLETFVARQYPTGLKWNPSGLPLAQAMALPAGGGGAAAVAATPAIATAPTARRGPPPPPPASRPPPPSLESLAERKGAPGGASAALFAALQKGEGVTSGLRKVTDDMKSKNQAVRSGVVPAPTGGSSGGSSGAGSAADSRSKASGTPRIALEQERKWVVEHQIGQRGLVLAETTPKQAVYMYRCKDSVLQVKGKVNSVTLDGCSKVGLVFEDVIAACEAVNCNGIQLQCTGRVPTISVEKCDGVSIYLAHGDDPDLQIVTAKCSEVNVILVPPVTTGSGREDPPDPIEMPIPEQFISTFRGGKLVTVAATHSGA